MLSFLFSSSFSRRIKFDIFTTFFEIYFLKRVLGWKKIVLLNLILGSFFVKLKRNWVFFRSFHSFLQSWNICNLLTNVAYLRTVMSIEFLFRRHNVHEKFPLHRTIRWLKSLIWIWLNFLLTTDLKVHFRGFFQAKSTFLL